jgi:hypothetical protein
MFSNCGCRCRSIGAAALGMLFMLGHSPKANASLPAPAVGLTANAVSTTQINLTWTDSSTNETGFEIWRMTSGGTYSQVALTGPNATSYSNQGLTPSTTYTYKVRPVSADGPAVWFSNQASATTYAATVVPPAATVVPPAAPSGLNASAASTTQINLAWTDSSTNETGFEIWRKSSGGVYALLRTVAANVTSTADAGLTPSTSYTYEVRAISNGGASSWSNEATGTTQATTTSGTSTDPWISSTNIELLGNPAAQYYTNSAYIYARNVWDLQSFNGRVYIGNGNASNNLPAANAGPCRVWSYNPTTAQFAAEYTAWEEQIGQYEVVNGELLIPGWDPQEDWTLGNFHRLRNGQWSKIRTIPNGVHTFDICAFQGALFATGSTGEGAGATVWRSTNDGLTWTSYLIPSENRGFSFFTLNNQLYVTAYAGLPSSRLCVWTGSGFSPVSADMFLTGQYVFYTMGYMLARPVNFLGQLVYIGANNTNDQQWTPFGLYTAAAVTAARKVTLGTGELPYDIVVYNNQCYVLTATPDSGQYLIRVRATSDLLTWREVLKFRQPTFARSFEILGGDYYFGLGCNVTPLPLETGNILRVRGQAVP